MPAMLALVLSLAFAAAPEGQIAFVSGAEQKDRCVHVLDLASRSLAKIGPGSYDGPPRWSPDGTRLAFESRRGDAMAIYVVQADGANGRFLHHAHASNRSPAWSADGRKLAYSSGDGLERTINVYDLAANQETVWGNGRVGLMKPVWLPDQAILAILASIEGFDSPPTARIFEEGPVEEGLLAIGLTGKPGRYSTDIFVVTANEAFPFPEWALPSKGNYAEWAVVPHMKSRAVAFESNDGGDREIFILTPKGAFDVSNHHSADWNPVWAPGGKWIAFESFRGGTRGVYRVHRDTNRVFPVAASPDAENWAPAWSPDGKWLAYVSNRTGNPSVYVCDERGRKSMRLTDDAIPALAPAWRPKGP